MKKLIKKNQKESIQSASEKKEILWNVVNALLAGGLVLLGSFSNGEISLRGIAFAVVAGLVVAVTRFQDYWKTEESEYCNKSYIFKFF